MNTKWKNTGAPFELEDGTPVETGEVFVAAPTDRDVRMRRRKLHPVAPDTPVTAGRQDDELDEYATGGGWFDIPGAGKVQGREKAREALREQG